MDECLIAHHVFVYFYFYFYVLFNSGLFALEMFRYAYLFMLDLSCPVSMLYYPFVIHVFWFGDQTVLHRSCSGTMIQLYVYITPIVRVY